jgi:hypothetical protein
MERILEKFERNIDRMKSGGCAQDIVEETIVLYKSRLCEIVPKLKKIENYFVKNYNYHLSVKKWEKILEAL